jgi:hypothetical protein
MVSRGDSTGSGHKVHHKIRSTGRNPPALAEARTPLPNALDSLTDWDAQASFQRLRGELTERVPEIPRDLLPAMLLKWNVPGDHPGLVDVKKRWKKLQGLLSEEEQESLFRAAESVAHNERTKQIRLLRQYQRGVAN